MFNQMPRILGIFVETGMHNVTAVTVLFEEINDQELMITYNTHQNYVENKQRIDIKKIEIDGQLDMSTEALSMAFGCILQYSRSAAELAAKELLIHS